MYDSSPLRSVTLQETPFDRDPRTSTSSKYNRLAVYLRTPPSGLIEAAANWVCGVGDGRDGVGRVFGSLVIATEIFR